MTADVLSGWGSSGDKGAYLSMMWEMGVLCYG